VTPAPCFFTRFRGPRQIVCDLPMTQRGPAEEAVTFCVYTQFTTLDISDASILKVIRPRLHETGTNSNRNKKISIYSPCQAIFFFRWLLLACVVPMPRLQPRPVWNVFVFTFIPIWIHAGLKSVGSVQHAERLETGLSCFRPSLM
jgi:hypothetical protein